MKKQGIYPTIFLTFKDEKHNNFENLIERMKWYVTELYNQFKYVYDTIGKKAVVVR